MSVNPYCSTYLPDDPENIWPVISSTGTKDLIMIENYG